MPELATHRRSHHPLLRTPSCGGGAVDAIVMPAFRPAANLLPAMEVAAAVGSHFVALCSGRARLDEAANLAAEVPDLRWTLIPVHDDWSSPLLTFGTSRMREATDSRLGDLSTKRNIGLLLAHLVGWRGVMFVDDDIRDLSPRTVRNAGALLEPGYAVGAIAEDFPDNSVVCHALRRSGMEQGVFVSGSALAVDTTAIESFFPEIYNEDWLFLYDLVRKRRVSASGTVRQAHYRPYADPHRAAGEEFGDVLAEGLMSLLHEQVTVKRALKADYWQCAIDQRHDLLDGIMGRLPVSDAAPRAAVAAAQASLCAFDSELLATYVRTWRDDIRIWRKRIEVLDPVDSVHQALDQLGLPYLDEQMHLRARFRIISSDEPVRNRSDDPAELVGVA